MFGPLPVLHRILLVIGAVVIGLAIGAWSGLMPTIPVPLVPAILVGGAVGVVSAYLLLHDFHHGPSRPPGRGRRRVH